jgi:hypothetical protein
MSAQEQALRDLVIAKIGELRTEITRLNTTIAAVEKEVKSQPLTKPLDLGKLTIPLEGWVQSMMESVAVIVLCGSPTMGGWVPKQFEDFARDLGMSLNNWRVESTGTDDRGRPRRVIQPPAVPGKTLKGHEDVRRVLSERNGKPVEPTRYTRPELVYPTGVTQQDVLNERSKFVRP